jgi:hypothetical protein
LHLVYFEKQILGRVIFLKHSKYISFFYWFFIFYFILSTL